MESKPSWIRSCLRQLVASMSNPDRADEIARDFVYSGAPGIPKLAQAIRDYAAEVAQEQKTRADGFEILLADALVREERLRYLINKALDGIIEASDLAEKPLKT